MRVCVIGGGLFGQVIAKYLTVVKGCEVPIVDNAEETRGSRPAACLIKPSWVSSMPKGELTDCLYLLDHLYDLEDISFEVWPTKLRTDVHWVNPSKILKPVTDPGKVVRIVSAGTLFCVQLERDGKIFSLTCDRVVIAAGVWTVELYNYLFPNAEKCQEKVEGIAGRSFTYRGQIDQPFIRPWAPYKQLVAFNRSSDTIWVGDGAAIKEKNWGRDHSDRNQARCDGVAEGRKLVDKMFGLRPYIQGAKPALVVKQRPGVWLATGGAKNGTVAAAWAALKIGNEL